MQVPWALPQGRFTLLFERFAVDVLLACGSVSQACELLGIGWEAAHEIISGPWSGDWIYDRWMNSNIWEWTKRASNADTLTSRC